jgi:hypothetical protein
MKVKIDVQADTHRMIYRTYIVERMKSFEIGKTKTGNLPNDLKSAFI